MLPFLNSKVARESVSFPFEFLFVESTDRFAGKDCEVFSLPPSLKLFLLLAALIDLECCGRLEVLPALGSLLIGTVFIRDAVV